jgi:hypothetical protein
MTRAAVSPSRLGRLTIRRAQAHFQLRGFRTRRNESDVIALGLLESVVACSLAAYEPSRRRLTQAGAELDKRDQEPLPIMLHGARERARPGLGHRPNLSFRPVVSWPGARRIAAGR